MQSVKFLPIIVVVSLVLSLSCKVFAAEDLSNWTQVEWGGNITMAVDGTSVDIVADTTEGDAWHGLGKYFDQGIGATADIVVNQSSGSVAAGVRQYVGTTADGTRILAQIYANQYKVTERDSNGNTLKVFSRGKLGNYYGVWENGEKVTVGFAHFNEQIWFYTPNNGAFVKIQLRESLTSVDSEMLIDGWATPDFDTNSISATVSNVSIIYPDNLQVFDVSESSREDYRKLRYPFLPAVSQAGA